MSEHRATIEWSHDGGDFAYESYSRSHLWHFPGGTRVRASSAPEFLGDADAADPEEAFVAAVASCHMLSFLAIAARKRLVVTAYRDEATGFLAKNEQGRLAITEVVLRPSVDFAGTVVTGQQLSDLHDLAHKVCFIANSVRSEIRVEPRSEGE